ncbi:MAG: hypothetical protein C7B46_07900 [Sulfobacillus benefaciens]|uniref:Uncharacterized protein n=1 Tax=Sulfobacillus benefaciens TaxID=453960 RepID=A0A2T2XHB3_9FIRM|nr:MAG: hypothetical protein C7B46_07900 [Sulfobacillus benefaciens]
MSGPLHFWAPGGASLATVGLVQICRRFWPQHSIAGLALIASESLVLMAALVTGQLRWGSLPDILFNGMIAAVCATQSLQGHDEESQMDDRAEDPVLLIVDVVQEPLSSPNEQSSHPVESKSGARDHRREKIPYSW